MAEPDDRLDDLLDAWYAAARDGRDVPAAELCRECPDLLPEVERRLAVLRGCPGLLPEVERQLAALRTGSAVTAGPPPAAGDGLPWGRLGRYRVVDRLGAGGMGEVYRAEDPVLDRQVAVKVLRPEYAAKPAARARFLREARAAAAVRHDHVVPIYHVDEDGGTAFIVMPLLAGESLEARLGRGPLPPAEVVRVGREAAVGLAAAHAAGLVHRDVKPSNLWLEAPAGRVLVFDFGLARSADAGDGLTATGVVVGTVGYMAPEQADGQEVDARADLFGLGAVLYQCATGRPAFAGKTHSAVLRAVAEHHPDPPRLVNPAVPEPLSRLILRLLAKRPADRPASAAAVADELAADTPTAVGRPRRRWAVWAAVVAVLGVGVAVWAATRPGAGGDPTPEPAGPVPPPAPIRPAPVTVERIEVLPHRHNPVKGGYEWLDLLGYEGNLSATVDQAVTVDVRLSRPAHAFLVVFRADGVDQVLYPQDADDVPEKAAHLHYPSKRRDAVYELNDGPGLWAVAVVTSDEPLPCYREWRAKNPGGPWRKHPTPPAAVVFDDGQFVDTFAPGRERTRGDRGEKVAADRSPVVALVNWLRERTGSPAAALAFPVRGAK